CRTAASATAVLSTCLLSDCAPHRYLNILSMGENDPSLAPGRSLVLFFLCLNRGCHLAGTASSVFVMSSAEALRDILTFLNRNEFKRSSPITTLSQGDAFSDYQDETPLYIYQQAVFASYATLRMSS